MIFVSVGMHYLGFDRLIKKMDDVAQKIPEEVIMQTGSSKYVPKFAKYFKFNTYDEMIKLISKSRLVVCQGAMTAMDSILLGKFVIIVPRSSEYNEISNNHQEIFAKKLAMQGYCLMLDDPDFLTPDLLLKEYTQKPIIINNKFLDIINKYIIDDF